MVVNGCSPPPPTRTNSFQREGHVRLSSVCFFRAFVGKSGNPYSETVQECVFLKLAPLALSTI